MPGDSGIRLLVPASRAQTMAANFHSGGSTLPPFQSPLWMVDCFFSFLMISCVYRTKETLKNVASPLYIINIIITILTIWKRHHCLKIDNHIHNHHLHSHHYFTMEERHHHHNHHHYPQDHHLDAHGEASLHILEKV